MADDDDLLKKADSLMRRHRVFVAGAEAADDTATQPDGNNDDVPVLTEVVDLDQVPPAAAPVQTSVDIAALRSALAFELEAWLDEELPQHVLRVLDGITDQLIIQLSLKARSDLLPRLQSIFDLANAAAKPDSPES